MSIKSDSTKLLGCFAFALLSLALFVIVSAASLQNQQNNQHRPRRVGTQSPAGNQQQTNSSGEEVGEGDIIRINTQLVSVPAVVTDKTGHPVTGLHAENFAVFEDG